MERKFPDEAADMRIINELLSRTVVQHQRHCLPSAKEFLAEIDAALATLKNKGQFLADDVQRPCFVCGRGTYSLLYKGGLRLVALLPEEARDQMHNFTHLVGQLGNTLTVRIARCGQCGHMQFFQFAEGQRPPAWEQQTR